MNWLNKPWVVAALSAGALGLMAMNLVPMFLQSDQSTALDGEFDDEDDWLAQEVEIDVARLELRKINATAVEWDRYPARNPFAAEPSSASAQQTIVATPTSSPAGVRKTNRLDGLVVAADFEFAVIDGEIVTVGDNLGAYTVTEISAAGVRLRSDGRTDSLLALRNTDQ